MQSEDVINKRFGRTIAKKRKAAGYTQEQVSAHLEIGKEAFSRIERGINGVSVGKLFALADLFGCGVETFFVEAAPVAKADSTDSLLAGLSEADRQLVVLIVEKLAARLKAPR
ncbi:helix-turn-helix domain-containing protein [Pelomonas aquatica]|uniref:helix-turn-helix domain-containing protein n=1 Tax=Pelomonas aquatica TaxID=431058 RepID=UPI00227C442B|nr:helix-turn-helix transcriptional regulator [Pelomonas aquatica]MCY4754633.1 helix-turn-helix transcriptional regulator [Pelomonas aquatica]